jgi:hypothetical protein
LINGKPSASRLRRLLYRGEKGSTAAFHKWVFYWFYPLHFLILAFIKLVLLEATG